MNKEIEEIMLTIPQKIVAYNGDPKGQHLYGEQRQQIAETLYNAGYRKVEKKDTIRPMLNIENLLQNFDEMGYVPTTLCDNPEEEAKKWKQSLFAEINSILDENIRLQAENNELNAKLRQVLLSIDTVKEMNIICNIDEQRKQAVKEFAEKLKRKAFNKDAFNDWAGATYVVLVREIDKLLKEYER